MSLACTIGLGGIAAVVGGGVASAAGPDPAGTVYVADEANHSIDVFAAGANGNVAPIRAIQGSNTGLGPGFGPDDVKVDSQGDVWATTFSNNSIVEFAPGASGNATPICTIGGSNTGIAVPDDFSIGSDGTVYVANFESSPGSVEVFVPGSCGNVTPEITISGSNTGFGGILDGLGVDATGTLYVANTEDNAIDVFAPGANGNVAPTRTIVGADTGLGAPDDVIVGFDGKLYVTNGFGSGTNSVTVYAPGASGDATPIQQIKGSNTDFGNPDDMAVDAKGDILVTDEDSALGPAVLEWTAGSTGNVAPTSSLAGNATTFIGPEGVAIAGAPKNVSATLTSQDSGANISLGSPTSDTATLAGGTVAPTGSIEFKLFGPGDTSCTAAPVYTSPFSTVTGDGSYPSPTFMPTAVGTYRWVALYSGDTNNAAQSTTCGDPNETVTVQQSTTVKPPVLEDSCVALGIGSATITPGLDTAAAGDRLVAYAAADGPRKGGQSITVSGLGLTWTKVASDHAQLGDDEVWTAKTTSALVNGHVTATAKIGGFHVALTVAAYKNSNGIGAVQASDAHTGAPTGSITTTAPNSWVWASGYDWLRSRSRVVGSGQTLFSQQKDSVGDTYWVQNETSPTAAPGAVTINDTAPTTDPYELIVVEILGH